MIPHCTGFTQTIFRQMGAKSRDGRRIPALRPIKTHLEQERQLYFSRGLARVVNYGERRKQIPALRVVRRNLNARGMRPAYFGRNLWMLQECLPSIDWL